MSNIKRRSDAKVGDAICVTGKLGISSKGLVDIMFGDLNTAAAKHHRLGQARTTEGAWLGARSEVHAMMDVSDGLSSELLHICKQSGTGCRVYEEHIPLDYQTAVMAEELNMNVTTCALNGGEDYELLLTTKATKEIAGRYGGLENLGDTLMKSENFEMAIDEIVWLITLLANQSIQIHNLRHNDSPRELLTEEVVELLTVPADLATYKAAITEAMYKGTKRNIESEKDAKNVAVG